MRPALLIATITSSLVACAHGNVTFISGDGTMRRCAVTGLGAIGAAVAQDNQNRCVDSAKAAGYIPVEEAGSIGLVSSTEPSSLRVASVLPSSPADLAGIRSGDSIVAVDDQAVKDWIEARRLIFGRVNTAVKLTYTSGGTTKSANVVRYPFVTMPNGM